MFEDTPGALLVGELCDAAEHGCSMAEYVHRIAAWERVSHWAQAMQAIEVAAFASRRIARDEAAGEPVGQAGKHVAEEVALARRVSTAAAGSAVAVALDLIDDFPATLAGMLCGKISASAARSIVKACAVLDRAGRRETDLAIAAEAAEFTPGQLREAVARRVISADPSAAKKRAAVARQDKQVALIAGEDSMAALWANLPAEQALACWKSLDNNARSLRFGGDPRSLDHLRCDTLYERVTGISAQTPPRVEVQVVISAASLLGDDAVPAHLPGYGALPADVAIALAESPDAFLRRLVCDPVDGTLVARGDRRYRIPAALRAAILSRDQRCRMPGCTAPIREVDHVEDFAHGGRSEGSNLAGLCTRNHHAKHHPGFDVTGDANGVLTWTTPTGHQYFGRPPPVLGYGSLPPERERPPAQGEPAGRSVDPDHDSAMLGCEHGPPT